MKQIIFSIILLGILSSCGQNAAPETTTEAPKSAITETVTLSADQMKQAGIEQAAPTRQDIVTPLTVNGTVVVLPDGRASVTAKIAGRVEQFFVHEGQNVEKGQALLSLSTSTVFDLQQAYLQAKADLIFLEKELERQKTLSNAKVGADKNYDDIQSRHARAMADLRVATAKLNYLDIPLDKLNETSAGSLARSVIIRAPISGNITSIDVNLGSGVAEGGLLCSIVGMSDLHAHVEVFAKDIALVQVGMPVTIRFPHTSIAPITTKVEYMSRDLSPDTKTYSIHIHLPASKGNYLPGMPLVADIHTRSVATLSVPESAVLTSEGETYCFVKSAEQDDKISFRKIVFEPVLRGSGLVGLPDVPFQGQFIVVKGANLVDGEMRKGEMQ